MNNTKRTPGKLNIREYDDLRGRHPDGTLRPRLVYVLGVPDPEFSYSPSVAPTAKQIALCGENGPDAQHLAACWNACEGINPELVPKMIQMLTEIEIYFREQEAKPWKGLDVLINEVKKQKT